MIHHGSCHCGAVAFEVEGDITQLTECNCSICSKKGGLMWFAPRGQLRLLTPEANLATYTFGKHRIQHRFCPKCGMHPFGEGSDAAGNKMAAINVRCLDDFDFSALPVKHFDGRTL